MAAKRKLTTKLPHSPALFPGPDHATSALVCSGFSGGRVGATTRSAVRGAQAASAADIASALLTAIQFFTSITVIELRADVNGCDRKWSVLSIARAMDPPIVVSDFRADRH